MNEEMKLRATPDKEDFRKKYESGKIGDKLLDGYFRAVRELTQKANIKKFDAVAVEIGCGEGYSTKRIADFLPSNIRFEASEYVEHQIKFANENNPGIKIIQESVYDLQRADKSFDLVYLLEVAEHLDYPEKALKEISRILKDDGYLIIGVPREPIWRALNMLRGKYLKDFGNTTGHLNHWSSRGFDRFIKENFGTVVEKKHPLPWTIILAKKNESFMPDRK